MVFFVILGIVLYGVANAVEYSGGGPFHNLITRIQAQVASSQVQSAFTPLNDAIFTWQSASAACPSSPQQVACLDGKARSTANAFGAFLGTFDAIKVPSGAVVAAEELADDGSRAAQAFQQLAASTSLVQYQATVQRLDIQQGLSQVEHDYQVLLNKLSALA